MTDAIGAASSMVAALCCGAVIGLERGWRDREHVEGSRVAGLRTFALIGVLGGALGLLVDSLGPWPATAGLLGLALLIVVSYRENVRVKRTLSATSAVAGLLAYALGVLAASGQPAAAVASAVVVAWLLDLKPTLHRWLRLVERRELSAGLQLLVLSVAVLPLLPDAGYGPYGALNPYRLWWAVVLIAALSLCGHIAMRMTGPRRGLFWTGVLGGFASSTGATLALARRCRAAPLLTSAAAAGVVGASASMYLRLTLVATALSPSLARMLAVPFITAGSTLLILGVFKLIRSKPEGSSLKTDAADAGAPLEAAVPFDLATVFAFGALLSVVAVMARYAQDALGTGGIYGLSFVSGLADVDAILITVSRLHANGGLPRSEAVIAVSIAVAANAVAKTAIAGFAGTRSLGATVALAQTLGAAAAIAAAGAMYPATID